MSDRTQIGWVRWSRTIEGYTPVYVDDFHDFDPDEDYPTDDEMQVLVDARGDFMNPLTTTTDLRWVEGPRP